jgi:hypothetical protein
MKGIVDKAYFLFYKDGICKAKMACNVVSVINGWRANPEAKEVTKEEYEAAVPITDYSAK